MSTPSAADLGTISRHYGRDAVVEAALLYGAAYACLERPLRLGERNEDLIDDVTEAHREMMCAVDALRELYR